jgi:hypothetical protein
MSRTPVGAIFNDPTGIGSTLTRRRPAGRPPAGAGEPPPRVVPNPEPDGKDSSGGVKRGTAATKTRPAGATKRPPDTIVYVTPEQAEAVRAERRTTGKTITEIVLSAVEETAPRLTGAFDVKPSKPTGRLFQGSQSTTAPESTAGRVQLCLRMIKSDRDALDALAESVKAPSRSHLVRKALDDSRLVAG